MKNVLLLALPFMILLGCGKAPEHVAEAPAPPVTSHDEGKVKLSTAAQKIAGVELATTRFQLVQDSIQVPGTVMSTIEGRAVVTPPVAGRIISISVHLGDLVRQGQTLAVLESPELAQAWSSVAEATKMRDAAKADIQQARSEVDLSMAKLNSAQGNLARQKEFVKAGAFSQAPVQLAQNDLVEAQSQLLSAQKELVNHAAQLQRLENLYRDGIVSKTELEAARLELQQDQIRLDRAKAKIESSKATYDREKTIATRGLINAKELQTAEAEVRSSRLELARARLRVKSAESALASANRSVTNAQAVYRSNSGTGSSSVGTTTLTAPISGTITLISVSQGQAVDRTQVLLEVENLQSVWVTANVPEQDSGKVKKGARVTVTVAALPGQDFDGIVQVVGSKVDPKTRSVPAQCLITGAAGRLKPDMFAMVSLGTGSQKRVLVVPRSAIVTEDRKSHVFVKDGDQFVKRDVVTGQRSGDSVPIYSGLKEGDQIASKGSFVLTSEFKKSELQGHGD